MKQIALLYAAEDQDWADWIQVILEESELYAVTPMHPGRNALFTTHVAGQALVIFSPSFLREAHYNLEWTAFFVRNPTGEKRFLIPVVVRSCPPSGLFGAMTSISLVGLNADQARSALLDGLSDGSRRTKPPFPGREK